MGPCAHFQAHICMLCLYRVYCLHALMFKKWFDFLILPVLQRLFSPSVGNKSAVFSDWLAGQLCGDWSTTQEMSHPLALHAQCVGVLANRGASVTL